MNLLYVSERNCYIITATSTNIIASLLKKKNEKKKKKEGNNNSTNLRGVRLSFATLRGSQLSYIIKMEKEMGFNYQDNN